MEKFWKKVKFLKDKGYKLMSKTEDNWLFKKRKTKGNYRKRAFLFFDGKIQFFKVAKFRISILTDELNPGSFELKDWRGETLLLNVNKELVYDRVYKFLRRLSGNKKIRWKSIITIKSKKQIPEVERRIILLRRSGCSKIVLKMKKRRMRGVLRQLLQKNR